MSVTLKQLVGNAGAGIDDSFGFDNLYDVLKGIATAQNALIAAFNVLLAEYNAETNADHTTSAASTVSAQIVIE